MSYESYSVVDCDGHVVESMSSVSPMRRITPTRLDLPAAVHEIDEVGERNALTARERRAVLADNARRFFGL
ncbi:MAG TPA: hypothetical protein VFU31_26555 [Candidatus Binatia bacterium]|nr:hypothetical protein [Candidatus Binatia bacterium]